MNEQTRYRVTGAVFLLAVAIILLPMVFDGRGVPVEPLPDLTDRLPPLPSVPVITQDAQEQDNASVDIAPEVVKRHIEEVEAAAALIDVDGFDTTDATRIGDPNLLEPREETEPTIPTLAKTPIWAVQLASFASPDNATAFRNKLLADGFEAWLSTAKKDQSVRTRVAIGPLLDRDDAQRVRALVSDRYSVEAIVVEMRP